MIHARNFARGVAPGPAVALADPHSPTLRKRSASSSRDGYADYTDALADSRVDAVVVVTPTSLHKAIVLEAARAGKHVLCEKPMAMDVRECDEMIAACSAAGVKLQVGFMRRYDESFRAAKERIEGGEIGEVVS